MHFRHVNYPMTRTNGKCRGKKQLITREGFRCSMRKIVRQRFSPRETGRAIDKQFMISRVEREGF